MRLQNPTPPVTEPGRPAVAQGLRRAVYLSLGWFFLGLAVLGALLPVLPTTPFLLLTSYFFVRSSQRLHEKLLGSRLFGPLLRDWHRHRGVRLNVKITAVAVILLSMTGSIVFGSLSSRLLALLIGGCTVGLIVVLRLPLVSDETADEPASVLRVRDFDKAA